MESNDILIARAIVAIFSWYSYEKYSDNDIKTKAIAAGLQQCESDVWKKECK